MSCLLWFCAENEKSVKTCVWSALSKREKEQNVRITAAEIVVADTTKFGLYHAELRYRRPGRVFPRTISGAGVTKVDALWDLRRNIQLAEDL